VQAGVLGGEVKDVLLLDVTPLSLGIETLGGVATKLIMKNTTIPTSKSQIFSTAADNQTSVEVHVVQGEREMAQDNKSLGRFILDGIPPAPRGVPQVEVTFDIDANGILKVSAREKQTGKEQTITITGSTGLSKEEVERMTRDAEMHAEEDRRKKEEAEVRNHADSVVFSAEKALKDAGDKISDEVKKEVQDRIDALKPITQNGDLSEVKKKTAELSEAMMKIGQAMYGSGANSTNAADQGSNEKKDGEVQEGEVVN
jgi:molecular chaperone DnaK